MKKLQKITLSLLTIGVLASCSKNDDTANQSGVNPPSAQGFTNLHTAAYNSVKQQFTLTAENGLATFTSTKGVIIKIQGTSLRKNGNPVTGAVNVEFAEVFDGGKMLTTDKTTMGLNPATGQMEMIISGGEFFIEAKQSGTILTTTSPILLDIPGALTGGTNPNMRLWTGQLPTPAANMLGWIQNNANPGTANNGVVVNQGGPTGGSNGYSASLPGFGWTNVDRFYSDPRPRTLLLASVPAGYNPTNCAIYLHYDGLTNSLAKFDTYQTATQLFSEHYGQIPIGLVCHAIFVTEDNGQYRYAIKAFTVQANDVYNFTLAETVLGTQAQLEAAINALP